MPEAAFGNPRMGFHLGAQEKNRLLVLLDACFLKEREQWFSRIDLVDVVFFQIIGHDLAIIIDELIIIGIGVLEVPLVTGGLPNFQNGQKGETFGILPFWLFAKIHHPWLGTSFHNRFDHAHRPRLGIVNSFCRIA